MKVSVLLLTYNEAANLRRCLDSLTWCDDIIVVDSGSTDDTVSIAEGYGARVLQRPFDNFANQRNFGLDSGEPKHEWVLHLDADEVAPARFVAAVGTLAPPAHIDAYRVPSKLMMFDRWLRHAGMWPTYQVRIGHRERLRFKQIGHGQREALPSHRVGTFLEPYLHYSFSLGLQHWLLKHVRYAADEAKLILHERKRSSIAHGDRLHGADTRRRRAKQYAARIPLFLRPAARFFYIYVLRQGFRDGRAGFAYAFMLSVYEGMTAILAYEALMTGRSTGGQDQGGTTQASWPMSRLKADDPKDVD